jgi:microcystin-dependent protein
MSDSYLGEVRAMSFGYAPRGWAMCHGQMLPIGQNQALYSLLGPQYGGDGTTNFALPSIPGAPAQGGAALNYCICLQGSYPQR